MKYILGIDPGIKGGLALLSDSELMTFEMPSKKLDKKSTKRVIDEPELARLIDSWSSEISNVVIEQVHAMPGQGVTSMFSFGLGYGIVRGIISANFLPTVFVSPQAWKSNLGVPKDKNKSREKATELFPHNSSDWSKVKWDGRAEAAMIAYYGKKIINIKETI